MRRDGGAGAFRIPAALFAFLVMLIGLAAAASNPPGTRDLDRVLKDLETYSQTIWDSAKVPGMAYAVVQGSEIVYARGFGKRSQDASAGPVDEHTLFEIGSCTKAFNAAVLGTVVDEGKVAWMDKVQSHLPDFKMFDPWVTKDFLVADLMAQRSGMPEYSTDVMSMIGFGKEDIMRATRLVEPVTSFRSSFAYQNNLHLWAAELVEKKTGLAWEEAVKQRLLDPLGMSESTFDFAAYDANPNHCLGHVPQSDGSLWTIPPDWPYRGWLSVYAPAGGLCSNLSDMTRWVALHLGNGSYDGTVILKPETLQAIWAPRIYMGAGSEGVVSYATGWAFQSSPQTPYYWHNGETVGMHSIVAIYPQCNLGLVVLTNASENKIPECMAQRLRELLFDSEQHQCPKPGMADLSASRGGACEAAAAQEKAAAIPLGKLAGTYVNPAFGKAVVKKEGSGLTLSLGPAKRLGTLSALGSNQFSFQWPEWPGKTSKVVFTTDASGNVTKLTFPEFFEVRGGDFKRQNP